MNLIKSVCRGQRNPARLALVGLLLFVWVPDLARPQEQEADPSAQESETVRRYREVAEKRNRPIDHYNLGTALLREGQVGEAQYPLQESLGSERTAVREHNVPQHAGTGLRQRSDRS